MPKPFVRFGCSSFLIVRFLIDPRFPLVRPLHACTRPSSCVVPSPFASWVLRVLSVTSSLFGISLVIFVGPVASTLLLPFTVCLFRVYPRRWPVFHPSRPKVQGWFSRVLTTLSSPRLSVLAMTPQLVVLTCFSLHFGTRPCTNKSWVRQRCR